MTVNAKENIQLIVVTKSKFTHAKRLPTQFNNSQHRHYFKSNEVLTCTSLAQKVHNSGNRQIQIVGHANKQRSSFGSSDCVWSASLE